MQAVAFEVVNVSVRFMLFQQIAVRFTNPVMVRTSTALYKPFSMLAKQESLPPLPVPPLQQTMDKYLKAIKPLVDEEDFEYTEDLVKNFSRPKGDGEVLQNLLLEKMKTEKNWVSTNPILHRFLFMVGFYCHVLLESQVYYNISFFGSRVGS